MIPQGPLPQPTTTLVAGSQPGVELAVHDYGGDGRPMVFIHGTGLVSRMWEPVIERLDLAEIRPMAIDLRLHGASRQPEGTTYVDHQVVADLAAVAERLGIDDAWGVGHSMGGATLLQSSLVRPTTFAALWVYEPIIFQRSADHADRIQLFADNVRNRRATYPSRDDAAARYGSRPPLDELHPAAMTAYLAHGFDTLADGSVELACDPADEARAFLEFLQDGWDDLPRITVPTLVAHGGAVADGPPQHGPAIAARLPAGHVDAFEGSLHFGPFGQLDRAATSIADWFRRV